MAKAAGDCTGSPVDLLLVQLGGHLKICDCSLEAQEKTSVMQSCQ